MSNNDFPNKLNHCIGNVSQSVGREPHGIHGTVLYRALLMYIHLCSYLILNRPMPHDDGNQFYGIH
jgi:hypothetical protein